MSSVLLIGSGNKDKARELSMMLKGLPWEVKGLGDFPAVEEPEETEETFEGNALLKAKYYSEQFGVACVADDSGLAVDALDGAPGVYSARYAGEGCSYADNNSKLLDALEKFYWPERTARFLCCAAFYPLSGEAHTVMGTVEGHIAVDCSGASGFGYDPVFVPDGHDRTFAEMRPEEKHAISHRGRAFTALKAYLEALG